MKDMQVFENTEFGALEILTIDGKPYFRQQNARQYSATKSRMTQFRGTVGTP